MDTQGKSDPEPRDDEIKKLDDAGASEKGRSADVASQTVQYEHFSPDDPYRTERTLEVGREAGIFCQAVGLRLSGLGEVSPAELQRLSSDAQERARWPKSQTDAFQSILRMGNGTPPRAHRIL